MAPVLRHYHSIPIWKMLCLSRVVGCRGHDLGNSVSRICRSLAAMVAFAALWPGASPRAESAESATDTTSTHSQAQEVATGWMWSPLLRELDSRDNPFHAIEVDGNLLVTGYSTRIWNGDAWVTLPGARRDVLGFVSHAGHLYTHTKCRPANKRGNRNYVAPGRLLRWDGQGWSDLDSLPVATDAFLVSLRDQLFTCGKREDELCLWMREDEVWKPLAAVPPLQVNDGCTPAIVWNDQLFVAGSWKNRCAAVYKFDGQVWSGTGHDLRGRITSFAAVDGDLYAAGVHYPDAPELGGFVIRYRDGSWIPLGSDWSGQVIQLLEHRGRLVALGMDEHSDGTVRELVRVWEDDHWTAFGELRAESANSSIQSAEIRSITTYRGDLVVVGDFGSVDGRVCRGVARWDGAAWRGMGGSRSLEGEVRAILSTEDRVFVAGGFTIAGDLFAPGIVEWDETEWRAIAAGAGGFMNSLAWHRGSLIAAGNLPVALHSNGMISEVDEEILAWDGSVWQALGFEGRPAHCLAVYDGDLLVGRDGAGPDGERILRWNGRWSVFPELLIPGVHGYAVEELVVHDGVLFAAGPFGVCRWNRMNWERIGWFERGSVAQALASIDGQLLLGGRFDSIEGVEAANVARWDGSRWHPLGAGVTSDQGFPMVSAFVVLPADRSARPASNLPEGNVASSAETNPLVLIGGKFDRVGDQAAGSLAVWDGTKLDPLLPGIDEGFVNTLAARGDTVFVGGYFLADGTSIRNFGMLVREDDRSVSMAEASSGPSVSRSKEHEPAPSALPNFIEPLELSDQAEIAPPGPPWSFATLSAEEGVILELLSGGCYNIDRHHFVISGGDSLRIECWEVCSRESNAMNSARRRSGAGGCADPDRDPLSLRQRVGEIVLPRSSGVRLDRMIATVEAPSNVVSTAGHSFRWLYYRNGVLIATLEQSDHGRLHDYGRAGAIAPYQLLRLIRDCQ